MNILLVEDEKALSNAIKKILEGRGYFVDAVYDGLSAIDYAKGMEYNLIILDVMLPKLDGFEVVRILRKDNIGVPVLMLTARTMIKDKVTGLNYGADDYMTKPFDTEELLARVSALTRRRGEVMIEDVGFEDLTLDLKTAELRCNGESVQLSKKEFEVMKLFLYNPKMTFTKDNLIINAWGMESEATDNNVEVYISFIRKKLKYLKSRVSIKNIQKIGYRLEVTGDD
ncbi:MAG: response regulator transcription factor [Clostridia bacterium]|nr:response regulator transcription factor [Clostridia bacterium]